MLTWIIIPIAVFIWMYFDAKGKRETVLEISKHLDDSSKVEELLAIFEERKKEPRLSQKWNYYNFCRNRSLSFGFYGIWKYTWRDWTLGYCHWCRYINCWISLSQYGQRTYQCCWRIWKEIALGKNHKKLLNNLEELRKSAGLTQQELSVAAEVSRKSINAIENGIYIPSTVLALKIAKTIECTVEDLF